MMNQKYSKNVKREVIMIIYVVVQMEQQAYHSVINLIQHRELSNFRILQIQVIV